MVSGAQTQTESVDLARVGVVVIGRNEGERLVRCLASVPGGVAALVYVDSGSTDGSVANAASAGAVVHELDQSVPFSAARARHEGVARLREVAPSCEHVLFIDGDCELCEGWVDAGVRALDEDDSLAAVCGRIIERHPERSIYNRLMQLEWDRPPGFVDSCPGISTMRLRAYEQSGGFDPAVVAGEEPELCFRMRSMGWRIRRLDHDMVRHDAAITRFGQWWKRCVRGGYAAAMGMSMHGRSPERYNVARVRRAMLWGLVLPVGVLVGGAFWPWAFVLLLVYPAQALRLAARHRGGKPALAAGIAQTIDKFPQALGVLKFYRERATGAAARPIEYKSAGPGGVGVGGGGAVAYVAPMLPAASETFVYREVRALRARGHEVVVVSLRDPGQEHDAVAPELGEGRVLVYGSAPGMVIDVLMGLGRPLAWLRAVGMGLFDAISPGEPTPPADRAKLLAQAFAGIVLGVRLRRRASPIGRLHAHFAHAPGSVAMYAAAFLGAAFSWTGHANDLFQRRLLLKKKIERADGVACISEWHRGFYNEITPRAQAVCRVIRCGVDTDEWIPAQAGEPGGVLRVFSVGRFVEKKGFDLFLRAIGELVGQGVAVRGEILGDGPERARLESIASELGLGEHVSMPGSADNETVREAMGRADVFLLPCREDSKGDRDGLPVVLLEAMARGMTVVVGDLPAIRELVEDGVTGRLVQTATHGPIARVLRELVGDPSKRESLAVSGRRRVEEEFSQRVNIVRLEEMFGLSGQESAREHAAS